MSTTIPVTIEFGAAKIPGTILKLSTLGMMVEVDVIPFPVGAIMPATFTLEGGVVLVEKMRSIKHYDRFFRNPPKKNPQPGEPVPAPKKLCELHFQLLTETGRVAITKYLLALQQQLQNAKKK